MIWNKNDDPYQARMASNGVFDTAGPTGAWLIWIAYAMGARNVYVTGIDGWIKLLEANKQTSYSKSRGYKQDGSYISKDLLTRKQYQWDDIQGASLQRLQDWALVHDRNSFQMITPTAYDQFYDPTVLKL